jgi:hypothetical protein
MNLSRVISQLKMMYGLNSITLPLRDDVTGEPAHPENIIREVLTTMTIPMYSQFVPWERELDANVNHLEVVDRQKHIYKLPRMLCVTPIMWMIDVRFPYTTERGTFGDIAPAFGINQSVQGVITSQEMMMLAGEMRAEPTFEYLGENQIQLFGFPRTVLTFIAACEHEENGETIPQSCVDSFMQLAELDMQVYLYNTLKYYDQIPTAFGNINMKIEEYSGAKDARQELLNTWRDTFHLDQDYNFKFM